MFGLLFETFLFQGSDLAVCQQVKLEEIQYILRGFEDSIPLYSGGLFIAGDKLQVTRADDQIIYAQKVRHSNETLADGSLNREYNRVGRVSAW